MRRRWGVGCAILIRSILVVSILTSHGSPSQTVESVDTPLSTDTTTTKKTQIFGTLLTSGSIYTGALIIPAELFSHGLSSTQHYPTIRNSVISQLIQHGFDGWHPQPYENQYTNGVLTYHGTGAIVWRPPTGQDALDQWIQEQFADLETLQTSSNKFILGDLLIDQYTRSSRSNILLFHTQQDLTELGYQVISHRRRISDDQPYRRTNIAQSFTKIGHVRVINPGSGLAFMDAAQYDGSTRENYEYGYVVIGNEEKMDYAGGICGASSAIYQGIVHNGALETPRVRNHTRWYGYLYDAYIDGELISTPGIDSAVFEGSLDLEMVNTASHPIIIGMNFDGTAGGVEEVFTLGRTEDRREVTFISSDPYTYRGPHPSGTGEIVTQGGCYTRRIGEEDVRRCYRVVE